MTDKITTFMKTLAPVIADFVKDAMAPLRQRITELEKGGIRYEGVWQASREYQRGTLVTHDGGMWHANGTTRQKPGNGADWTLAVKSGERR